MLNRLLVASAAFAVLVLAPNAAAKGIERATVCGVDDCVIADQDDIGATWLGGGSPSASPGKAKPWYRAKLEMGDGRPGGRIFETFAVAVVPTADSIRSRDELGGSTWSTMSGAQQAVYRRLTGGLEPFPADTLKGIPKPSLPAASLAPSAVDEPAPADDGGPSALPWLIGLAALTGLVLAVIFRRARRRSAPPATA